MKASDYIIQFLAKNGVHHLFQVIGGAITHLVDSTIDCENVCCVTMHHEQAAAFAAEGYARCNGKLGVAMATSGPGATNLITGIGSCFFDSVPSLFITGQVNTYEYKFDRPIRQVGFQETDIVSIIKPITKGAKLVTRAADLPNALKWAVELAKSGRPGPVLLDIPMDIQRAEIADSPLLFPIPQISAPPEIAQHLIEEIALRLCMAKRPVILAGGGIRQADAVNELSQLIEATHIPITASLLGLDACPHTHPAYAGMIGSYGNRYGNLTIANADFLIVIGSRLDTRQTGTRPDTFARGAVIVHVDIDEHELNRAVKTDYPIHGCAKNFLIRLLVALNSQPPLQIDSWLCHIAQLKKEFPSFPLDDSDQIDANEFMFQLSQHAADDALIVLDVGQHQMWAAQSFMIKPKQRMLISGGMGAMGFALPAAIGAAFAEPHREIIVITGDGGLQMNIQEFQTIVRNHLPIKIILMNNQSLGMVRQFQHIYFNGRLEATVNGYDCPDFIKVSHAYGISAATISRRHESEEALRHCLSQKGTPFLLEVLLQQCSRVEPKLRVNHPIEDQDPKISRERLETFMLIPLCDLQEIKSSLSASKPQD